VGIWTLSAKDGGGGRTGGRTCIEQDSLSVPELRCAKTFRFSGGGMYCPCLQGDFSDSVGC
jgi:hypothetical protein